MTLEGHGIMLRTLVYPRTKIFGVGVRKMLAAPLFIAGDEPVALRPTLTSGLPFSARTTSRERAKRVDQQGNYT